MHMSTHKTKTSTKIISLILAQVFLAANLVYPASLPHKQYLNYSINSTNIAYIPSVESADKLRSPMGFGKDGRLSRRAGEVQFNAEKNVATSIRRGSEALKSIVIIDGKYFKWDAGELDNILIGAEEIGLTEDRAHRLNTALDILRRKPEGNGEPVFTKEELKQATARGFQLYKGFLAGRTFHDNVPGINLALLYSKNYVRISGYTRALLMAHEFSHAIGRDEKAAYEAMVIFLVRHGLHIARQIQRDIGRELKGVGQGDKNLLLELVDAVIKRLEQGKKEERIIKEVKSRVDKLANASDKLNMASLDNSQHILVRIRFGSQPRQDTRRGFIKYIAGGGIAVFGVYKFYHYFDQPEEIKRNIRNLVHMQIIPRVSQDDIQQYRYEVRVIKDAQNNSRNRLRPEFYNWLTSFLTPGRINAINFSTHNFGLEPELLAAFLFEENLNRATFNKIYAFFEETFGSTIGLGQVGSDYMVRIDFLKKLCENKEYFIKALNPQDRNKFEEFVKWYESETGSPSAKIKAEMPDTISSLAEIEEINIFLAAFVIRDKARLIANDNRNAEGMPGIVNFSKQNSIDWALSQDEFMKIREDLKEKYGKPFGNIEYYHPLMRYFAVARRYSGRQGDYERGLFKAKLYFLFLQSGLFKQKGITAGAFGTLLQNRETGKNL